MATVFGSSGNDFIHVSGDGLSPPDGSYTDNANATTGDDLIFSGGGGTDLIHAGDGNDSVQFAGDLDALDQIDGGSGTDVVQLQQLTNVALSASSLTSVEEIDFLFVAIPPHTFGFDSLTMNDANVAAGKTLIVDATPVDPHTFFTFDGSAEQDGHFTVRGGPGPDTITGGALNDIFDLSAGGVDSVSSGGGHDTFNVGDALTPEDSLNGDPALGGTLSLSGDVYESGFVFGPDTIHNINVIDSDSKYSITMNDGNVAAGAGLAVLYPSFFDGSAETDGHFTISDRGGYTASTLIGGGGADTFYLHEFLPVGDAIVEGGNGNDTIWWGLLENVPLDKIDGGGGKDTLYLNTDITHDFSGVFSPDTLVNVEKLNLASGTYHIATDEATVAHGKTLTVDGTGVVLNFDGSAETDGAFKVLCGDGSDVLVGGAKADIITGGGYGDTTTGGVGGDTFVFTHASDSTGVTYDTITDLDMGLDRIDAFFDVTGIDGAVIVGKLRSTNFDHDLANALSGHLGKHHAVLFTPDSGDLAGQTFLIVDRNGHGYHGGADLVIDVTGATGTLTTGFFI